MAYPILTRSAANSAYLALLNSEEPNWVELEAMRGSGTPKDYYELKWDVDELMKEFPGSLSEGKAAQYEGLVGVLLHENISDAEATSDPDFWRYIALRPLLDATLFRHSTKEPGFPSKPNFGIGSLLENFAFRAWMRAEIGYDPEAVPGQRYVLALRGDQDLWRSHLIRVRYSFHRAMAHALIEFQYPTDDSSGLLKKGDKKDGIRMLAKRLQRSQANTAYSLLSREQCRCLISELARGLTLSDGEKYTSAGAT